MIAFYVRFGSVYSHLGRFNLCLGVVFVPFVSLGSPWGAFGCIGALVGGGGLGPWEVSGGIRVPLGSLEDPFGAPWASLSLRSLEGPLGVPWDPLWSF